jgi:AcrR family transcriptional regulator
MSQARSTPRRVDPDVLEQRRVRRRERVVARLAGVVADLVETQGSYLDVTVEQILGASDMSRSTFYRYFEDKVDHILALGDDAMTQIIAAAQAIWELPSGAGREEVAAAVHGAFAAYVPHLRLMGAVHEVSTYDARARDRFGAAYAGAQRALAAHLRAGQAAGFVRPDLHPDETAGWLTWMVESGMHQLVHGAGPARRRRLEESFTAILWQALYEKPAGR